MSPHHGAADVSVLLRRGQIRVVNLARTPVVECRPQRPTRSSSNVRLGSTSSRAQPGGPCAILLGFPGTTRDAHLSVERSPGNGRAPVAAPRDLGFDLTEARRRILARPVDTAAAG